MDVRVTVILGVLLLGSAALADDALVVVVESAHPAIRGAGLRRAMTRRGVPAVSVLDVSGETSGTLVVAVQRHRARMALTTPDGSVHVRYIVLDADHPLDLLANRATALVRSTLPSTETDVEERVAARSERIATEVLDPWSPRPAPRRPVSTEVVDPWRASVDRPVYAEVLDPWAPEPGAPTRETTRPPARAPGPNEVLDPWADPPSRRRDLRIPDIFRESASDLSSPPR